ncbi:MAG: hypothetical protein K1060chlam2_00412 [Chlamydiae bacterium]|nr:hypothetical protein [Chlamydiota bacterium]
MSTVSEATIRKYVFPEGAEALLQLCPDDASKLVGGITFKGCSRTWHIKVDHVEDRGIYVRQHGYTEGRLAAVWKLHLFYLYSKSKAPSRDEETEFGHTHSSLSQRRSPWMRRTDIIDFQESSSKQKFVDKLTNLGIVQTVGEDPKMSTKNLKYVNLGWSDLPASLIPEEDPSIVHSPARRKGRKRRRKVRKRRVAVQHRRGSGQPSRVNKLVVFLILGAGVALIIAGLDARRRWGQGLAGRALLPKTLLRSNLSFS